MLFNRDQQKLVGEFLWLWCLSVAGMMLSPFLSLLPCSVWDYRFNTLLNSPFSGIRSVPAFQQVLELFFLTPDVHIGLLGFVFSIIAMWQTQNVSAAVRSIFILLFSTTAPAQPLAMIAVMMLSFAIFQHDANQQMKRWLLAICGLLCPLITVEYGLAEAWIVLLLLSLMADRKQLSDWLPLGGLLFFLFVASCFSRSFFEGLLRPASFLWTPLTSDLFPAIEQLDTAILSHPWLLGLLLAAFGLAGLQSLKQFSPVLLLVIPGLLSSHYLWYATFGMAIYSRWSVQTKPLKPAFSKQPLILGAIALALTAMIGLQFSTISKRYEHGQGHLQPEQWNTQGQVLLFDLNQSSFWQKPDRHRRYSLTINDRWDQQSNDWNQYLGFRQDLGEVRGGSYLRSDLSWGGYTQLNQKIQCTVLSIPSDQLEQIRRVSLSPHWSLMGMDSKQVLFGWKQTASHRRQFRNANNMVTQLEWPSGQKALPDNTIVAQSATESLQISKVLQAMRFPYAALRYLPEQGLSTQEENFQRAMCLLEMAHRTKRHSGQPLLVAQARALHLLSMMQDVPCVGFNEALMTAKNLKQIGSIPLAIDWANQAKETARTDKQTLSANLLIQSLTDRPQPAAKSSMEPMERFQFQLAQGDFENAKVTMELLKDVHKQYAQTLWAMSSMPATDCYFLLEQMIKSNSLPPEHKEEAYFIQGSLALEIGDTYASVTNFQQCLQHNAKSPYLPLVQMYVMQLSR